MASNNIKGIVVKIGANTSDLVKSLKDVESEIKSTQNALKKVNEALKLDPKNVELIAEKQKLLKEQIENTEQKLRLLEESAKDANQALADGTISEQEYAQLTAEIARTTAELKNLNEEAKKSGDANQAFINLGSELDKIGGKISSVGDSLKGFGETLSTHVTAPIVALGVASVEAFREVDAGLDNIVRKTGVTGDQLQAYEDIMNNIARTVPADFNTIGNAVGEVATRFNLTGQELEDLSSYFVQFASVNGVDVVTSVDDVQKALSAFGMDASDATRLLDRLTRVSQNTGANVSTLANGLIQNATAFEEMGLNIDQATIFMGRMETSGANAESVMQALRKALKNATADGTSLNDALANLQNEILNGTDSMDGLTYAYELFGRSGDQIYSAVRQGTLDFTNLAESAEDASGTVGDTFSQTVDPITEMQTTVNELKITLADIGETMATTLQPALESLNTTLQSVNEWWNSLDDSEQQNILTALAVVASIGPIIAIIGSFISSLGGLITSLGAASTLMGTTGLAGTVTALGASIAPVIVVVGSIIAILWGLYEIVTGLIYIFNNWDTLMWALNRDFGFIFDAIKQAWENLVNSIKEKIDEVKGKFDEFKENVSAIKDHCREKVDEIISFFAELPANALTWGRDLMDNFINGIRSKWDDLVNTVSDFGQTVRDYIGFSEPKLGALSDFHTFAPDMVDLWSQGVYDNLGQVEQSANVMAQTMANGVQNVDYSSSLNNISSTLSDMAGSGTPINVYIGSDRIGTAIARSNSRMALISGGM